MHEQRKECAEAKEHDEMATEVNLAELAKKAEDTWGEEEAVDPKRAAQVERATA